MALPGAIRPLSASVARAAGPALVLAAGIGMAAWTWGQWPDTLIDFGRELYLPWQLAAGKVLYRDIAHLGGPFSPYLNALLFAFFGPGIRTLAVFNMAVLAALAWILYDLLRRMAGRLAATAACLILATLFGFAQFSRIGNYNYVCPYSHDLVHGLVLAVAGIALAGRGSKMGVRAAAGAGLCLGLLVLTKTEALLAGGSAIAVAAAANLLVDRPPARRAAFVAGAFAVFALLPVATAFVLLSLAMPAGEALRGTLAALTRAAGASPWTLKFYRAGMGIDDPGANLVAMLGWTGRYLAVLVPLALVALALRGRALRKPWCAAVVGLAVPASLVPFWKRIDWPGVARPLPLLVGIVAIVSLVFLVKRRRDPEARERLGLWLSMSVLALGLLPKMVLNARVYHYGFVLAMPGTLLLVAVLLDVVPRAVERLGGYGHAFRASAAALLVVVAGVHLVIQARVYDLKQTVVASGPDRFVADRRGQYVNEVAARLERMGLTGRTLAVMPEGAILNYLLRMENPTPYIKFLPLEFALFGEERVLRALEERPPDLVALVHMDTSDEGFRFFGRDYGRSIFEWVRANYRPLFQVGSAPLRDERFGILVLGRADLPLPFAEAAPGRP